ncbi:NUDIX domain-containing protein [Streptomyces lydicus]|uniref:NUDIX domain-containing protein n=1 Tax=Streptomyces lydicus TaxID=47763 RepID=UPI0037B76DC6
MSTLPGLDRLPIWWRHGDFGERNLWCGRRWALIDFERSEPTALLSDFVKLATSLGRHHPALRPALLEGYDQSLSDAKECALAAFAAANAASALVYGPRPRTRGYRARRTRRQVPDTGGMALSEAAHLLIGDVAQNLLRANGAALCLRRRPDAALALGQRTAVGSHLKAGEPLNLAARREAKEDAGSHISADQQEFGDLVHRHEPGGMDRITAVIVAQAWTGEPHNAEPDKHEGLFWVSMEKPPPDCHPYTVAIFHMLTHGPSHQALNWPTLGGTR